MITPQYLRAARMRTDLTADDWFNLVSEAADRIQELQNVVAACYDDDCFVGEQAGALRVMPWLEVDYGIE